MSDNKIDIGSIRDMKKRQEEIQEVFEELHALAHMIEEEVHTIRQRASDLNRDADMIEMKLERVFELVHQLDGHGPKEDK